MNLTDATDAELAEELQRRGAQPFGWCACGKWSAYMGAYDRDGYTLRCSGCKKSVTRCTC